MASTTPAVSSTVELVNINDEAADWTGRLTFDPSDPLAVTLWIGAADRDEVPWTFSLDLIEEGLYRPTGAGDVQLWPCLDQAGSAVVIVELASDNGSVGLQLPSDQVQSFLVERQRAHAELAVNTQSSIDAELDSFLDGLLA